MIDLSKMNVNDFILKEGEIKVDSSELKRILSIIQSYHTIIFEEMKLPLSEVVVKDLEFIELFQNKYIVLGELRQKQKMWFDILKKLDNKEFTKATPEEEIEKTKRIIWGNYIEAKTMRETIQNEINELSK